MTRTLICAVVLLVAGCHGGGGQDTDSVEHTIATSADDGRFQRIAGVWSRNDITANWIFGKTTTTFRTFMRWAVSIPAHVTISSAYIDFISETSSGTVTTAIKLIDADDCGDINSFSADQSDMTFTGDTVAWTPPAWGNDEALSSPDIATLVQAFIDRDGYNTGQYIGLFIDEGDAAASEWRSGWTWEALTRAEPVLRVIYFK